MIVYSDFREEIREMGLKPRCVYCGNGTNHECRIYREPICLDCADERNLFDGDDIISEYARDEYFARCQVSE